MAGTAIVTAPAKTATDIPQRLPVSGSALWRRMRCWRAGQEPTGWWLTRRRQSPRRCCCNWFRAFPHTTHHHRSGLRRHRTRFLLKFCARFPQLHRFTLRQPVRWAPECPLENIVSEALIFDDEAFAQAPHGGIAISAFYQQARGRRPRCRGLCISYCRGALSYFAVGSAPNDGCAGTAFLAGYGE